MIKLKFRNETKNKIRYEEIVEPEDQTIETLYIRKSVLKQKFGKYPKHLLIELREE